jgi:hypothetical protein
MSDCRVSQAGTICTEATGSWAGALCLILLCDFWVLTDNILDSTKCTLLDFSFSETAVEVEVATISLNYGLTPKKKKSLLFGKSFQK